MLEIIPKLPINATPPKPAKQHSHGPSLLIAKKAAVISQSFDFEGTVRRGGNLCIEGRFKGEIFCDQVQISQKADVTAHIECKQLFIKGHFKGSAKCSNLVVNSTAVVDADIQYESMTIGSGAQMGGRLLATPTSPT